ncbi:SWIM zinc finger family protein [Sulfolobus tengchongensis]|uniref:SWIM zinc finger family protein n=1 Tax=Sulfolobus tengchongensis TaxID=207809 RepID=A0AAX4L1P1_9CREN
MPSLSHKPWFIRSWISMISSDMDTHRRKRGFEYFKEGRVKSISIKEGKIIAKVQGNMLYEVRIEAPLFTKEENKIVSEELNKIIEKNSLPVDLEIKLNNKGLSLLPKHLIFSCSCPDYARPCKHILAVQLASAELFEKDVRNYLTFRGLSENKSFEIKDLIGDPNEITWNLESLMSILYNDYEPIESGELKQIYKKMSKISKELLRKVIEGII